MKLFKTMSMCYLEQLNFWKEKLLLTFLNVLKAKREVPREYVFMIFWEICSTFQRVKFQLDCLCLVLGVALGLCGVCLCALIIKN